MYKNILVPVDLAHKDAAKEMIELARSVGEVGAKITVLHAVPEIPNYLTAEIPANIMNNRIESVEEELEAMADGEDTRVCSGPPARGILNAAEKEGHDLIVIASHQPGLRDYLLGSTAARVVRYAKCSVLVMR